MNLLFKLKNLVCGVDTAETNQNIQIIIDGQPIFQMDASSINFGSVKDDLMKFLNELK